MIIIFFFFSSSSFLIFSSFHFRLLCLTPIPLCFQFNYFYFLYFFSPHDLSSLHISSFFPIFLFFLFSYHLFNSIQDISFLLFFIFFNSFLLVSLLNDIPFVSNIFSLYTILLQFFLMKNIFIFFN